MPNRIIKESICTSENLDKLTDFEENLFYKIIVNCDDYGRFDARPAIIKARCYPLRERLTLKAINEALSSLARVGCIEIYTVENKSYLRLPAWEVHQQVRAQKSKFPAPDSNGYQMISDDCKCSRNPIVSKSENESVNARTRAKFAPPSVDEVSEYCLERNNGIDATAFIDYYASRGWMLGRVKMKDWKAAVRTWEQRRKDEKAAKPENVYRGGFKCNKT